MIKFIFKNFKMNLPVQFENINFYIIKKNNEKIINKKIIKKI